MARTPAKLNDLLLKRGVQQSTIDANLNIVQGNVKNESDVSQTLTMAPGTLADIVISGIGTTVAMQWSLTQPMVFEDLTICAEATRIILDAMTALQRDKKVDQTKKPFFAAVSTTGISKRGRDVPLAFTALYHWLLAGPHVDKEKMETMIETRCAINAPTSPVSGFAVVRASLLMDGKAGGARVGWEWPGSEAVNEAQEEAPGAAIGYTINRDTVSSWMFKELVESDRERWSGKMVTLTE